MYTIVVCPDCEAVNTVKDHPARTKCDSCRSSHKFDNLRSYYETDSREEMVQARAMIAAKLRGEDEMYERAKENGVLDELDESQFDPDTILRDQGMDADSMTEKVNESVDRSRSKSQQDVMWDAITEQNDSTTDNILSYAEDHGIDREKAARILQKLRQSGEVTRREDGTFDRV